MEITVKFDENSNEFDARFYDSAILEPVYVTPDGRDIVVKPNEKIDGFSQVTVHGDDNLKPENIVNGVTIYGVKGTRQDAEAVLTPVTVVPTGRDFTEYPRFDGFSEVTVAGDYNLTPENIAEGITIYGVEGTLKIGAAEEIPPEYESFIEHAKLLYTGDYANLAILESNNILNVAFLMDDFKVLSYNESTTEFTAIGWLYCEYTKATQTWRVVNYTTEASTGVNYVKHIRYSSVYWEYNGQVIWPVGAGGGLKPNERVYQVGNAGSSFAIDFHTTASGDAE